MVIHCPPASPEDVGGGVPVVVVDVVVAVDVAVVVVAVVVAAVVVEVIVDVGTVVVSVLAICTFMLETVTMILVTSFLGGASVTSILTYPLPAAGAPDVVLVVAVPGELAHPANSNANTARAVNITEIFFMTFSSLLKTQ